MNKRNNVWQFARGIAILAVIFIHCPNGIGYELGSFNFNSWMVTRQCLNFPVALFIFMAGYFVNLKKIRDYKKFLFERGGVKILLPYLIWTLIYFLLNAVRMYIKGNSLSLTDVLKDILFGGCAPQLYYCVVLLQLTILTPLLIRWLRNRKVRVALYACTPLWLIFVYGHNFILGTEPKLYNVCFLAWIGFYIWGILMRQYDDNNEKGNKSYWRYLLLPAVAVEIAESFTLLKLGCSPGFACSQIRFTPFLMTVILTVLFLKKSKNDVRVMECPFLIQGVIYIGNRSYGIFYVHYIFIMLIRPIIAQISVVKDIWLLQVLICFVTSLVLSLISVNLMRKLSNITHKPGLLIGLGFN